jgi:hypothetical protein
MTKVVAAGALVMVVGFLPIAAARATVAVERVSASISRVNIEFGCGPTPVPNQPPPQCPAVATLTVRYVGYGCKPEDFFIRVRQRPTVQLVTLFKLASATGCFVDPDGSGAWASGLSRVDLQTPLIQLDKAVRLMNPLALPTRRDRRLLGWHLLAEPGVSSRGVNLVGRIIAAREPR